MKSLAYIALVFYGTAAYAQQIAPITPDVVMSCYRDTIPTKDCAFSCYTSFPFVAGTPFNPPPGQPGTPGSVLTVTHVSRVELITHGRATQGYDRYWIFYRWHGPSGTEVYQASLYAGSTVYCGFNNLFKPAPPNTSVQELRIEKFNQ